MKICINQPVVLPFRQHGRTPLVLAARNGDWKVVMALLENGASVDQTDKVSNTMFLY